MNVCAEYTTCQAGSTAMKEHRDCGLKKHSCVLARVRYPPRPHLSQRREPQTSSCCNPPSASSVTRLPRLVSCGAPGASQPVLPPQEPYGVHLLGETWHRPAACEEGRSRAGWGAPDGRVLSSPPQDKCRGLGMQHTRIGSETVLLHSKAPGAGGVSRRRPGGGSGGSSGSVPAAVRRATTRHGPSVPPSQHTANPARAAYKRRSGTATVPQ